MAVFEVLDKLAAVSAERSIRCGMPVLVVGGAVRDILCGKTPREHDFAFAGDAETFLQRNPSACKVGRSVSVILLEGEEYMPLCGHPEQDMLRRDLTINAFGVNGEGTLFAHPLALEDLRKRILRPASSESFASDPDRVFRLARLACEFPDFTLHEETVAQMRAVAAAGVLPEVKKERIVRELLKALSAPKPSRWLECLRAGNCLEPWFAEFALADTIPAGPLPYHNNSVLAHTGDVMDLAAGDPLSVWMAMCHDIGKTGTPRDEWPHHYGHEKSGEVIARRIANRLGMSNRHVRAGELACLLHMKAGIYEMIHMGKRCDILMEVHNAGLDRAFWRMVDADSPLKPGRKALQDLQTILSVTLPEKWQNRGVESGRHLRELRAQELANQNSTVKPEAVL